MRYVAIEGNVGAGKTTLIELLKRHLDRDSEGEKKSPLRENGVDVVLEEEVQDWLSVLSAFYTAPAAHSLHLQLKVMLSRLAQLRRAALPPGKFAITERCIESSSDVFISCLGRDGLMTRSEEDVYIQLYDMVKNTEDLDLVGVVYVNVSPETCYARTVKRDRPGEQGVTLEYLTRLHEEYARWMASLRSSGCPVLEIDGEQQETASFVETVVNGIVPMLGHV